MTDPIAATNSMIANLERQTGRTLAEWIGLVVDSGLAKHGQQVGWLKADHGLTHGYANLIALKTNESPAAEQTDLIEAQYSGKRADLRPIYDRIAAVIQSCGDDVEIAPKKSSTSFRRSKQFALAQPATNTRIDLGIQLKDVPAQGRLEAGDSSGMCTHRVRLTSVEDVDEEVIGWLREAYSRA